MSFSNLKSNLSDIQNYFAQKNTEQPSDVFLLPNLPDFKNPEDFTSNF